MAQLTYKTRGMSSPQGKSRVYFCSHSQDFDKYFEPIAEEILAKQNCSIWYKKDRNCPLNEEFWDDVKQMQLFVVPVTKLFLAEMEYGLKQEISFA